MPPEPSGSDAPSSVLRAEHRVIERVLHVLDRLAARAADTAMLDLPDARKCVEFFRLFADACHHAKEEDLLFPVLEQRGMPREGGPIGVMLHEHRVAREFVRAMGEALDAVEAGNRDAGSRFCDAARQYIDLLTQHIYKEDNILFMMGDRIMQPADQQRLAGEFCAVGCRAFAGKTREQLEQLAAELTARWGQ